MSDNWEPKISGLVQVGRDTDPEIKAECFRLWVSLGRSWRAVHRRTGIAERTLQRWAAADNWEERRAVQAAAFLPGLAPETTVALRMASHSAALRLLDLMETANERGGLTSEESKEVSALVVVVDRGGFAPIRESRSEERRPQSTARRKLTNEERAALVDRLGSDLHGGGSDG